MNAEMEKRGFSAAEIEFVAVDRTDDIITTSDNGGSGGGIVLPIDEW